MKAICFMQEVKEGDLTIREQMLVCRRALRKLRWPCVLELFAQAGTEEQPLSLRPGMVELLHAAANGEADVLVVVDAGLPAALRRISLPDFQHCRIPKRIRRSARHSLL